MFNSGGWILQEVTEGTEEGFGEHLPEIGVALGQQSVCQGWQAQHLWGMTTAAKLAKLPATEKIALIEQLWESIPADEIPVAPAQVEEAQRRLDELKRNPQSGLTYDELRRRLG